MKIKVLIIMSLFAATGLFAGEGDIAQVGQKAFPFSGVATDGASVSLEAMSGKVVVLDFFATWCGPCMQEMPLIEREIWQPNRTSNLVVIAIGREHTVQELAKFTADHHFSFAVVADPKREIYSKYAREYIPRCYIIGKDGLIKYAATGFSEPEFAQFKAAVAAELKK